MTGIYGMAKVLKRTKIVSIGGTVLYDQNEGKQLIQGTPELDNWFIGDFCLVTVPLLVLGGFCQINSGAKILGRETVTIGRGSVVSYDVLIMTSSDSPNPPKWKHNDFDPEEERRVKSASITIGNECFIGAKSVLMPGVAVPDDTVIPAMSYVSMSEGVLKVKNLYYAYKELKKKERKRKLKCKDPDLMFR